MNLLQLTGLPLADGVPTSAAKAENQDQNNRYQHQQDHHCQADDMGFVGFDPGCNGVLQILSSFLHLVETNGMEKLQ